VLKRKLERQVIAGFEPGTGTASDPTDVRPPRQGSGPKRDASGSNRQNKGGSASGGRRVEQTSRVQPEARTGARPASPKPAERGNAAPRRVFDEPRQPASNASSQFPSSGAAPGVSRPGVAQPPRRDDVRPAQTTAAKPRDGRPVAALLGGATRRAS
jgi:hypothetical protein